MRFSLYTNIQKISQKCKYFSAFLGFGEKIIKCLIINYLRMPVNALFSPFNEVKSQVRYQYVRIGDKRKVIH